MKSLLSPITLLRPSLASIGFILVVSLLLIALATLLHVWQEIPFSRLTRDLTSLGRLPWYFGFISQFGIFFWSASTAICFFCVAVLPKNVSHARVKQFLVVSAFLTMGLGFDDAFQLHELVFPDIGIPQEAVLASYAVITLLYLVRFYPLIRETEHALLAIALFFFSVSVGLDVWEPAGIDRFLFEDGAKLFGQVSWLAYFFSVGKSAVKTCR